MSVHVSMNLPSQQYLPPSGLPVHTGTQTRQPANCGSQAVVLELACPTSRAISSTGTPELDISDTKE